MLADTRAFYKELQQAGVRVLDTHNQVGGRTCGALQHARLKGFGDHCAVAASQGSTAALLN